MFSRSRKDEVNFEKIEKAKKKIVQFSNVSFEKICGNNFSYFLFYLMINWGEWEFGGGKGMEKLVLIE